MRDKFSCRLCGYKGPRLEAHHIIRLYDEIKNLNLDGVPQSEIIKKLKKETNILNIRNWITVCHPCHDNLLTGYEHIWTSLLQTIIKRHSQNHKVIPFLLSLVKASLPPNMPNKKQFKKLEKYLTNQEIK